MVLVDEEVDRQPTLPERGIIVVWRDLVEAELFVIIGTDPLCSVNGTTFQRRINVTAGKLLRDDSETRHDFTSHARNAHLQALQIRETLDFLAIPAAHLGCRVAADNADNAVIGEERIIKLVAAAMIKPGVLQTGVHAERNCRADGEGWILAGEVIAACMRHFDRVGLHRIDGLWAGHDFTGLEHLYLEFAFSHL